MQEYPFWGWENTECSPVNPEYPGIENPRDLYDALGHCWSIESCAPRLRGHWCRENKTLGQCSITAFLVQDIFGGEVWGIPRPGGTYHCFNVVGTCRFDLTSEQFQGEALDYDHVVPQRREVHFADANKKERYEMLKADLMHYCASMSR